MAVKRTPDLILPPTGFGGLSKPPPLGLSRPASLSSRGHSRSDSLKVKQTWTGVTAAHAWEVKGEDLEMVPMDYPLERTHRTIEGVDATEVARRISEALRTHSIEAKFDTKPVKAKCKTDDLVSFRIRLYAGGENGLPVVVEVQRRSGSASSFMKSCRAILAAAEGKLPSETAPPKRMPPFAKPPGQMKCLQSVSLPPLPVSQVADEEIAKAVSMIRSQQKDSNSLGLESLLSLTDPINTAPAIALSVSKCVILGDEKYDIREDIRAFTDRDVFEDEAEEEEAVIKHAERNRHLALSIFSNGLSICSRDGCLKDAVEGQKWFKDQFISFLLDELRLCESSACCAVQATRCIGSIMECSPNARRYLQSCGIARVLEDAHSYGKTYNDLLAEEARRCLKLLDE